MDLTYYQFSPFKLAAETVDERHMATVSDKEVQATEPRAAGMHARQTTVRLGRGYAALVVALGLMPLTGWLIGMPPVPLAIVDSIAIGLIIAINRYRIPMLDRWARGARGEEKVGAIIASLEADGWRALHDRRIGATGNIDHILIGPPGLFTIETKSHRGRIAVDKIDRSFLKQAYAEAALVGRITGRPVEPLLVFSDAYLTASTGKAINRRGGVMVVPARMLAGHLTRRPRALSNAEVDELYDRLRTALEY